MTLLLGPGLAPKALLEPVIPWRVRIQKRPLERTCPQLTTAEKSHFQRLAFRLPRWCWEPLKEGR